jgi:hypothetical protein
MSDMSREEIKEIADSAARLAVSRMLLVLGVDASDPKSMIELQADLAYTRKWRKSVEKMSTITMGAAITTIVTGIAALIWIGLKISLGRA